MATFDSHIIQYVGAYILGILILVIFQTCINNLYLLSHTQPFLDTDPRPPACHMIMPWQAFTSFISNVTRHPSWPRIISHISAKLSFNATFVAKNQTQAHTLWPYFKSLASFPRPSPISLRLAFSVTAFFTFYNLSIIIPSLLKSLRYKKATTKSRRFTLKASNLDSHP